MGTVDVVLFEVYGRACKRKKLYAGTLTWKPQQIVGVVALYGSRNDIGLKMQNRRGDSRTDRGLVGS